MAAPPPPADRYEPLPSLGQAPAWIWRRLPRAGRIGVALLPLVVIALAIALAPGIDRAKDERADAEAQRLAQARADRLERILEQQRPRLRSGTPAAADLAARERLLGEATASIRADARDRVAAGELRGPIWRVECEGYPRTESRVAAHELPGRRIGRYACLAVTAEFGASDVSEAGTIGHPYRLRIDFETGRYAFCKVFGRPGEGSIGRSHPVGVPRACGGA